MPGEGHHHEREFELATNRIADLRQRLTLFMGTCQRCGRCFAAADARWSAEAHGYRVDDVETGPLGVPLARLPGAGRAVDDIEIEL